MHAVPCGPFGPVGVQPFAGALVEMSQPNLPMPPEDGPHTDRLKVFLWVMIIFGALVVLGFGLCVAAATSG